MKSKSLNDYFIQKLKKECVYLLIKDWKVIYVGQSQCGGFERIAVHYREKHMDFDSYVIIDCNGEDINALEAEYIITFTPKLNKYLPNNSRYKHKKTTMTKMKVYSEPWFNEFLCANKIDILWDKYLDLDKIRPFIRDGVL